MEVVYYNSIISARASSKRYDFSFRFKVPILLLVLMSVAIELLVLKVMCYKNVGIVLTSYSGLANPYCYKDSLEKLTQ